MFAATIFFNILLQFTRFYELKLYLKFDANLSRYMKLKQYKVELTDIRLFVTKHNIILRCNVLHSMEV